MRKLLSALLATVLLLTCMPLSAFAAQGAGSIPPPDEEVYGIIEAYVQQHRSTTASVAISVFRGQEDVYTAHHGFINRETKQAPDEDTVYEWGSTTKLLTWVSVMQLVEQGQMNLQADIRSYLPEGFLTKLNNDEPITMMHLMNHTVGWQETTWDIETADQQQLVSLEQALKQSEPPQIYAPGEYCAYSNWGTALAGYIVERVSGMPFHAYVQEHIFEPLGMTKTALAPDLSDNLWVRKQRQQNHCYYIDEENTEDLGVCIRHVLLYPAGMATGTLDDLTRFGKAFLSPDGTSPLFQASETMRQMLTPTMFYGDSDIPRVSHGFWHTPYGVDTIGHPGNTAGSSTNLVLDPVSGRGVVVMTNQLAETDYVYSLMPLLFGDRESDSSIPVANIDLSGIYKFTRTLKTGVLRLVGTIGGGFLPLQKTDDPQFYKLAVGNGGLRQVGKNEYMLDLDGVQTFAYLYQGPGNDVRLQMMSHDNIKIPTAQFYFQLGTVLLAVLATLYALIALLVSLITLAFRRNRDASRTTLWRFRQLSLLSTIGMGALIYLVFTLDLVLPTTVYWKSIVATLLAMIAIVYTVLYFIRKKERCALTKKQKAGHVLAVLSGLALVFNVFYWQIFYFWI